MQDLRRQIETALRERVVGLEPVGRGYTPAQRVRISLSGGGTLFAKRGTTPATVAWLRQEKRVYETLVGSFLPRYLGWIEDEYPTLLIEDLGHAHWPPPWRQAEIDQVVATLPRLWQSSLPDLPKLHEHPRVYDGWQQVAAQPEPFLALGLASEAWLAAALPVLLGIDGAQVVRGESLLHMDLRSDNLCILQDRVVIVDWNLICTGNPQVDLGFWLPSLEAEGGPPPEAILPQAGAIAGLVSGFFAARAGLPTIPDAPRVRQVQQDQLRYALPWAVRALDLPPLR